MHVEGSCHCAAIRFEAEVDPKRVVICSCTDCQTFSGSAFRTSVLVAGPDFRLLEGVPKLYEKTSESGNPRQLAFCAACGTHLYGANGGDDTTSYSVRVGALAERAALPPVAQVWCRSALPWASDLSALHRIETQ